MERQSQANPDPARTLSTASGPALPAPAIPSLTAALLPSIFHRRRAGSLRARLRAGGRRALRLWLPGLPGGGGRAAPRRRWRRRAPWRRLPARPAAVSKRRRPEEVGGAGVRGQGGGGEAGVGGAGAEGTVPGGDRMGGAECGREAKGMEGVASGAGGGGKGWESGEDPRDGKGWRGWEGKEEVGEGWRGWVPRGSRGPTCREGVERAGEAEGALRCLLAPRAHPLPGETCLLLCFAP